MLLALPILVPLLTAIVLHLLPQRSRLLRVVAFSGSICVLIASVWKFAMDALLFPLRLAAAVVGFLNFFSMMFSNQPLITAGGPAPIIASWLMHEYHSARAVAVYMAACAVVSLVALALLRPAHGADE